ncbi:MAG: MarC family protein [Woeseia sp.]
MTLISATILLFLVMDPLGNIPFYLSALKNVAPERMTRVLIRELLVALLVLVVFLFIGGRLLGLLGISEPALTTSGGVILFLIALRMIFPTSEKSMQEDVEGEPFIVPLAIPYVAGPSSMATLILFMSQQGDRWPIWLAALCIAWSATAVILFSASALRRYLGRRGLIAMERLMGMVLIAIAIQMLFDGIGQALPL